MPHFPRSNFTLQLNDIIWQVQSNIYLLSITVNVSIQVQKYNIMWGCNGV